MFKLTITYHWNKMHDYLVDKYSLRKAIERPELEDLAKDLPYDEREEFMYPTIEDSYVTEDEWQPQGEFDSNKAWPSYNNGEYDPHTYDRDRDSDCGSAVDTFALLSRLDSIEDPLSRITENKPEKDLTMDSDEAWTRSLVYSFETALSAEQARNKIEAFCKTNRHFKGMDLTIRG